MVSCYVNIKRQELYKSPKSDRETSDSKNESNILTEGIYMFGGKDQNGYT